MRVKSCQKQKKKRNARECKELFGKKKLFICL